MRPSLVHFRLLCTFGPLVTPMPVPPVIGRWLREANDRLGTRLIATAPTEVEETIRIDGLPTGVKFNPGTMLGRTEAPRSVLGEMDRGLISDLVHIAFMLNPTLPAILIHLNSADDASLLAVILPHVPKQKDKAKGKEPTGRAQEDVVYWMGEDADYCVVFASTKPINSEMTHRAFGSAPIGHKERVLPASKMDTFPVWSLATNPGLAFEDAVEGITTPSHTEAMSVAMGPASPSHYASLSHDRSAPQWGGNWMDLPLCGDGGKRCTSLASPSHRASLAPHTVYTGPGGTRVYRPLCGYGGGPLCPPAPTSHWASLYHKTIRHRLGGLGCIRRCVRTGGSIVTPCITLPLGVPIPKNGLRRTKGTLVYLPRCGEGGSIAPPCITLPLGFPIPPRTVCPRPGGLTCLRRYVGMGKGVVPPCITLPLGVPIPHNDLPRTGGGSGVGAAL